jgi:hypothetical protein
LDELLDHAPPDIIEDVGVGDWRFAYTLIDAPIAAIKLKYLLLVIFLDAELVLLDSCTQWALLILFSRV